MLQYLSQLSQITGQGIHQLLKSKNPDIALEFGKNKNDKQISIGFALETNDIFQNAERKLRAKNFDFIVLNSPKINEGFGYDTNRVSILRKEGSIARFTLKSKTEVAKDIADELEGLMVQMK